MGNLTHVELLPAGGGLHDGGVDAELVAGAKDGDLHVPVGRAYKQIENILRLYINRLATLNASLEIFFFAEFTRKKKRFPFSPPYSCIFVRINHIVIMIRPKQIERKG